MLKIKTMIMDRDVIDTISGGISCGKYVWNRWLLVLIAPLFFVYGSAQQQYKVNASSLNVRSSPGKQGAKTGRLDRNEVVHVYEVSEDSAWAHIRVNSLNGWVSMDYLEPVGTTEMLSYDQLPAYNRVAKKVSDFLYNHHEEIYWAILSAAILILVTLAYSASRKGMLSPHLWRLGIIIALMASLKNFVWVLRWVYPAIICMLVFYVLLFTRMSAARAAKVMRWGICVWCLGAVWVYLNADPGHGIMIWWMAVLDGFVNWALFQLLSRNLEAQECPFCNEYADHPLVDRELVSREFRTEYAGEKTIGSGRITFGSSDIPDEPYSIKRDKYDKYQYDTYKEEYRCVHCRRSFTCTSSNRKLVATDV